MKKEKWKDQTWTHQHTKITPKDNMKREYLRDKQKADRRYSSADQKTKISVWDLNNKQKGRFRISLSGFQEIEGQRITTSKLPEELLHSLVQLHGLRTFRGIFAGFEQSCSSKAEKGFHCRTTPSSPSLSK